MTNRQAFIWLAPLLLAGQLFGCAPSGFDPAYEEAALIAAEEEAPLGGEALARRRMDLKRAWRDLLHFNETMQSLSDRKDSRGMALLDGFLAQYMAQHLDPLLRPRWQSAHPEVMAIDANLRFMKAQILSEMRYPRRVQRVIDDIQFRFEGRESMLIEYPVGEQRSLGEGLERLRERKWSS
jgi:hypothetical protein